MSERWKVEGAGPQEIGEGLSVKTPESSKCKRLVRIVIAAACLVLTCFAVGDISTAEAGCRRRARRYYVVERPVVVRERCVRPRYVPCRRRVVKTCSYYAPRYRIVRRRPVYFPVWEEAPCSSRLVYRSSDCDGGVVYVEDY